MPNPAKNEYFQAASQFPFKPLRLFHGRQFISRSTIYSDGSSREAALLHALRLFLWFKISPRFIPPPPEANLRSSADNRAR
jgi:hypothetical protein